MDVDFEVPKPFPSPKHLNSYVPLAFMGLEALCGRNIFLRSAAEITLLGGDAWTQLVRVASLLGHSAEHSCWTASGTEVVRDFTRRRALGARSKLDVAAYSAFVFVPRSPPCLME